MNKELKEILHRTVRLTHSDLYKYTILKLKFKSAYTKYPNSFDPELAKRLDKMIPHESEYFCQSVKLLALNHLEYFRSWGQGKPLYAKHYPESHIFAETECCACVIINASATVFISYISDENIEQHHRFENLSDFLLAACEDRLDDTENPQVLT